MFGRKTKTPEAVGIHVGRGSLTIARVARVPKGIEVRQLFHAALPRALSAWPANLVKAALLEARKQVNLKVEQIHLTLPSDLAPSHFLIVPSLKAEQLSDAVRLQLEGKWGTQCGELSFQFEVLEKPGGQHRIFSASVPTDRLRAILASFSDLNCPVDVVEVEGVSVANLIAGRLSTRAPVAVLQVYPNWGEIHVLRRDRIALSRPIPKLENEEGKPEIEAPAAQAQPAEAKGETPSDALGSVYLDRIGREVNKTLDYFEIELLCPAVERLFLIGEAASVPGMADVLADRLDVKVEVLDAGEEVFDKTDAYDPPRHCLAVAAALGGVSLNEN